MCLNPITLKRNKDLIEEKKEYNIDGQTFSVCRSTTEYYQVPCGKCIECEKQKSNEWAFRSMLEAQLHEDNCFITLTYDNEHLPEDRSVSLSDWQKFVKRLRKRHPDVKFKYLACGEYGSVDKTFRPHYHAVIFGYNFTIDNYDGTAFWSSELDELWPFGFHSVQDVTLDVVRYVAKYAQKQAFKVKLVRKDDFFEEVLDTSEVIDYGDKRRPFLVMSKGLGYTAWDCDVKTDKIYVNGKYIKTPRYFLDRFERENGCELVELRERRNRIAAANVKTWDEQKKHKAIVLKRLTRKKV